MRALVVALLFALAPPQPRQRWITVTADRLTVFSSAQEPVTVRLTNELVGMRREAEAFLGVGHPLKPARVFFFPTHGAFAPYLEATVPRRTKDASVTIHNDEWGVFHLIQADDAGGMPRLIPHMLAHDIIDAAHPNLPLWAREGLAEYWSGYHVDGKRYPRIDRISDHITTLKTKTWLPARTLFALDASSPLVDENTRSGIFHAQSWVYVHALMKGNDKRKAQFARFIKLTDTIPADSAFSRAFDMTPEDLFAIGEERLLQFNSPIVSKSPFPNTKPLPELPRPKRMEHDDILFELAQMLVAAKPENTALGEEFLARVSASRARAQALRGRLHERAGRRDAAKAAYAEALRLDGNDPDVLLLCANSVTERLVANDDAPVEDVQWARALFDKAARLDPTSVRAWTGLGATYVHSTDDPAPGIAAMEKASAIEPANDTLRFYLVELLLRDRNRMGEAKKIAETLSRHTPPGEIRFHLARLLTEVRSIEDEDAVLRGIESALLELNDDNVNEALRLIDEILPRIDDPTILAETRKWRAEIEQRIENQQ